MFLSSFCREFKKQCIINNYKCSKLSFRLELLRTVNSERIYIFNKTVKMYKARRTLNVGSDNSLFISVEGNSGQLDMKQRLNKSRRVSSPLCPFFIILCANMPSEVNVDDEHANE